MRSIGFSAILLFLLIPFSANSQGNGKSEGPSPMKLEHTQAWTDLTSKNGVEVQYKYVECHDNTNDVHRENVMLRFENTTGEAVDVSWKHLTWYDGNCSTCKSNDGEYRMNLQLDPNEVLQGNCDTDRQALKVFGSFLNPTKGRPDTELTGLRLKNLKVE